MPVSFACGGLTPPAVTFLDPASASVITLSGNNLIAGLGVNTATYHFVRSNVSHVAGKYYAEFNLLGDTNPITNEVGIGVGVAAVLNNEGSTTHLGGDLNSIAILDTNTGGTPIYLNNVQINSFQPPWNTTAPLMRVAVDIDHQKIWFAIDGGSWNGSGTDDPANNVGGSSFSTLNPGALYLYIQLLNTDDVMSANFGASAYTFTPPSGFGNW